VLIVKKPQKQHNTAEYAYAMSATLWLASGQNPAACKVNLLKGEKLKLCHVSFNNMQ